MPIWLRNFTFRKLAEWVEKQNDTQSSSTEIPDPVKGPNISPNYTSKAFTK